MTRFPLTARLWAFIMLAVLMPVSLSAAPFAAYVMDARTGQPIYKQNADTKLHPASLTKMMTLYLAFTAIERGQVRLDSKFPVSSNAAAEPPSKLGLRAGQKIELRYLLRAAAIKSANDAATAIGEGLAGSETAFAQQMTAMARALGMRNTQFKNANGLTQEGHYSTAHDMSILGRHLFYDFPQYYNLFSRRSADAGIAKVSSTNKRFLDAYSGADGIKTGYTRAAGFNLTASAQRGKKRLIATVFGGTSTAQRNQTMAQLLDSGFSRVPNRVRETRPAPPKLVAQQKVVRRAQVQPKPAATQPQTQRLVLNSSEPPAPASRGSASTAAVATRDALAAAMREATKAAPSPAASASRLALASSIRPRLLRGPPWTKRLPARLPRPLSLLHNRPALPHPCWKRRCAPRARPAAARREALPALRQSSPATTGRRTLSHRRSPRRPGRTTIPCRFWHRQRRNPDPRRSSWRRWAKATSPNPKRWRSCPGRQTAGGTGVSIWASTGRIRKPKNCCCKPPCKTERCLKGQIAASPTRCAVSRRISSTCRNLTRNWRASD